jgi:hypothetical protein
VDETYTGVTLRKTGDALFDSWHADEDDPGIAFVNRYDDASDPIRS